MEQGKKTAPLQGGFGSFGVLSVGILVLSFLGGSVLSGSFFNSFFNIIISHAYNQQVIYFCWITSVPAALFFNEATPPDKTPKPRTPTPVQW